MAWIESHTVLSRHRKVKETARALRIRPAYLIGHLHLLWHAALEQAEDGDLTRWSDEFIAESADYPGDAPQFVRLLQDHGWLDGRLVHDWPDYAGKFLMGKYAGANRERLVEIWAKYGRIYGKKSTKESPSEIQLESNQTPSTLLGKVGKVSSDLPPEGIAYKPPVRSQESAAHGAAIRAAGMEHATQAHYDRAKAASDAYPIRSKDGRNVKKDLGSMNLLAIKIARAPDFPWLEAATLENLNETPQDFANWVSSQPDPVMLETRRKQKSTPPPPKPGERPVKKLQELND